MKFSARGIFYKLEDWRILDAAVGIALVFATFGLIAFVSILYFSVKQ